MIAALEQCSSTVNWPEVVGGGISAVIILGFFWMLTKL